MGVSGAGKTTIGKLLASVLGWSFHEGDDFHPRSNLLKMAQGTPLSDEDRWPWLGQIRELVGSLVDSGEDAIITCSALRQSYREYLLEGHQVLEFVYLKGDYSLIRSRLVERKSHFMKVNVLDSQFRTLEEPEGVITIEVALEPSVIVDTIKTALSLA